MSKTALALMTLLQNTALSKLPVMNKEERIMSNTVNPTNKSALITGSSRGIGHAIAVELAKRGYNVCLNCSSDKGLKATEKTAEEIAHQYSVQAIAYAASVASSTESKELVDNTIETFGRLDVLVNNAGITHDKLIAMMSEDDFDSVIEVNLKGAFNCCKAATRTMMKQKSGRIINMSSVSGIFGNAGQVNYSASKAGIIGLTKSLAKELASRNITVNAVAPGFIDTDMTAALNDEMRSSIIERIGCKRLGTPEDIAAIVGFLASEDASYITGQVIVVDGGLTL